MSALRPLNVVVAGTGFGRVYLDALAKQDPAFRLTGLLARGGTTSRSIAAALGVPLYVAPENVPDSTDIVCVVVRSGATGGPGSELAAHFLRRGIHVLQEHPVHHDEIAPCLKAARQGNAAYAVNTLHPNLAPARRFLAVAKVAIQQQKPAYLDIACNSQMLYPLLDLAGRALGGMRPWSFGEPMAGQGGHPLTTLHGCMNEVPLCLRVQNAVHPDDPDNHSFLLGQMAIGFEGGVLALPELHGPVLWHARLHAPRTAEGRLITSGPATERLAEPSTEMLGPPPGDSWHVAFEETWPRAVLVALHDLKDSIDDPVRRRAANIWAMDVSQCWNEASQRLGMPAIIRPDIPPPIPLDALHAAADSIASTEGTRL
ncbi:Gfo/Idh/MocA family oxidoreductase [Brytella acorum]|uniref:Gfo/Idh/MocA family oxidoreductase n=1 Tax=Brytella acorum TaxID=2959299 RepID=A0AA35Y5C0_9PROT|nr:Gfo/Idh/MocA family oxidoreductase [Brytella acorum]CAI9121913.1 Gfo/Idh/MocA family oxidoreductase [Brytella acorum]